MVLKDELPPVLILAGGKGTRLQSVVSDRPKPMAEVAGKPFLEWLVLTLKAQKVQRIVFCTGYMNEAIAAYFGDGNPWGIKIAHSPELQPLGTGGAVRLALDLVESEQFFVLNGDSYCRADLQSLITFHQEKQAIATLLLTSMADCRRYGSVVIDNQGQIQAFQEKSPEQRPGLVNAGIYVLKRNAIAALPLERAISLETEFFPQLINQGLYGTVGTGALLDIGTPESYATSEQFLASENLL